MCFVKIKKINKNSSFYEKIKFFITVRIPIGIPIGNENLIRIPIRIQLEFQLDSN